MQEENMICRLHIMWNKGRKMMIMMMKQYLYSPFLFDFFLLYDAFPRFLLNVSEIVFIMCILLSPPAVKRLVPLGSQKRTKFGGKEWPSLQSNITILKQLFHRLNRQSF